LASFKLSPKRAKAYGVYEVACAHIEARDPLRDISKDGERQDALRKRLFTLEAPGPVDFDTLCDEVLASMADTWTEPGNSSKIGPLVGDEGHALDWR
jgi:hypothetical protein